MVYINNYPFVLIFFLFATFFVFFGVVLKIKIAKKIFIALSSLFFALFVIETILSFYMLPFITKPIELYNKRNSYFPQKGDLYKVAEIALDNYKRDWFLVDKNYNKTKSNFAKDNNIVIEAIYTLDENGFRYTQSNKDSEDAYLFLGCSFMFGACINDNETLPYLFSKEFNFEKRIINAGQDARGINRAYSILSNKDYLEEILGKSKLKYVFYEYMKDHVERTFRYNIPSDIMIYKKGREYEVEQPFKIIKKFFTRCLIYEKCFYDIIEKKSYSFYAEYINNTFLKMYNISKDYYGAGFIVIMWDRNESVEKFFTDNCIDFIKAYEILDYENDIVEFDCHPSINGNKKIIELITSYLKKKGDI